MNKLVCLVVLCSNLVLACNPAKELKRRFPLANDASHGGSAFIQSYAKSTWQAREQAALQWWEAGHFPAFQLKMKGLPVAIVDTVTGKKIKGRIFVSQDYLSIGNNKDWVRLPITPMSAQLIAEKWNCSLPTTAIADLVFKNANVTLPPVPLFAFRDSLPVFFHHHLIIEGQRKGRKGLIAGIKKDVVISKRLTETTKPNRVAIYGWHLPNGKPIQALYTGHINWYVDYSHGIRLVYNKMKVNGKWMDVDKVHADATLHLLISNEAPFLRNQVYYPNVPWLAF